MDYTTHFDNFLIQLGGGFVNATRLEGRKFDKVMINGAVKYFVARNDGKNYTKGDIFGKKSPIAPNFKWYYGSIENALKWDWTGDQPKPVNDDTVMAVKSYGNHVHYMKLPTK